MSKIGVGGVKLAMTEKGAAGGCQAVLCGERLSGSMACGRERRTGDEFLSVCHQPNGGNMILCHGETEQLKGEEDGIKLLSQLRNPQTASYFV